MKKKSSLPLLAPPSGERTSSSSVDFSSLGCWVMLWKHATLLLASSTSPSSTLEPEKYDIIDMMAHKSADSVFYQYQIAGVFAVEWVILGRKCWRFRLFPISGDLPLKLMDLWFSS
jgi:hypothetical protein